MNETVNVEQSFLQEYLQNKQYQINNLHDVLLRVERLGHKLEMPSTEDKLKGEKENTPSQGLVSDFKKELEVTSDLITKLENALYKLEKII